MDLLFALLDCTKFLSILSIILFILYLFATVFCKIWGVTYFLFTTAFVSKVFLSLLVFLFLMFLIYAAIRTMCGD